MAELTAAEKRLVEGARSGRLVDLSTASDNEIRGVVIRDLLRGHHSEDPDPRGVRLRGAHIIGELDLIDIRASIPLELTHCAHDAPLHLTRAHLPRLDLSESTFCALEAESFTCEHDLQLVGIQCESLNLVGANISGQVNATRARLDSSTRPAVNAERITVGNGLFLIDVIGRSISSRGALCLLGATITGPLELDKAQLRATDGPAINADWLTVKGSLFLNEGFTAGSDCERGTVRLQGMSLTGQLNLNESSVMNSSAEGPALVLIGAQVGSDLVLPMHVLSNGGNRTVLANLNGLQYPFVPRGSTHREWLKLLSHHSPAYAAQPYQQLASAHRAAGHEREARDILIAQQRDFRRRGRPVGRGRRILHLASGAFIGHGHRPFRALGYLAGVCLLAGITSLAASALGVAIRPAPPGGRCSPAEVFGLAADTALPLLKMGGAKHCEFATTTQLGQAFFAGGYVLHMLGWAFATLFVAGYTGLVRKPS
ncbi:hypothetical protein REH65_30275 [Saccharopolyspora sp. ID03-671]|uniref:hypothetical protein n=1 Tax=Saccharopolyspora sp. ID03-671 TaxID=3073066 RepID=UPI0032510147